MTTQKNDLRRVSTTSMQQQQQRQHTASCIASWQVRTRTSAIYHILLLLLLVFVVGTIYVPYTIYKRVKLNNSSENERKTRDNQNQSTKTNKEINNQTALYFACEIIKHQHEKIKKNKMVETKFIVGMTWYVGCVSLRCVALPLLPVTNKIHDPRAGRDCLCVWLVGCFVASLMMFQ